MESFEQLLEQYTPMIHKIIKSLHIYKNKDEFFQLGMISLWQAFRRFEPNKGDFSNYAYTFIKGKFLSEMTRSRKHRERTSYPEEEFWEIIEAPATEQPLMVNLLLSYCEHLTPNQTKWVLYTCLDYLNTSEIAEKENVSRSAVKAWRKGAKQKLIENLEIFDKD
jgi:RNA polymerase sigma factor (sigma-70 family)